MILLLVRKLRESLKRLSDLYLKYRWVFWTVVGVLCVAVIYLLFNKQDESDKLSKELSDLIIRKKKEIVDAAVSRRSEDIATREEKIKELEQRIEEINRQGNTARSDAQKMTLRELSDAFKEMGY